MTRAAVAAGALAALLALAGCGLPVAPSPTPDPHAGHTAADQRVIDALAADLGLAFEPAGPHHAVGTGPDGVEVDLVGVPVAQVVLSIPADDPEAGLAYLPHLRDLLHGPSRVYDWVAAGLACRAGDGPCDDEFAQGNLEARFTDADDAFVVLSLSRGR